MKSDLHHLFPTDDLANNYRGDNPFGIVTGATIWTGGGSKATSTLFEPRDAHKGRAARALMYFVLRYQDYTGFFAPQETVLRSWHHAFMPNPVEDKRNDDIALLQNNRNPFIDYPQFTDRITSIAGNSVSPVVKSIDPVPDTIIYGYVQALMPENFYYVIVNDGNSPVQCFNFSLSDPAFSFVSGGSDTLINPGESLTLTIELIAPNTLPIQAYLGFETDDSVHASVSIPVFANDSVFDFISSDERSPVTIYPNPVVDWLYVKNASPRPLAIAIYSLQGFQIAGTEIVGLNTELKIETAGLAAGVYILKTVGETGSSYCRFIKL
jgi:hypothetical protein